MNMDTVTPANARQKTNVRRMAQMGMLAAISVVLMLFEIPLHFTRLISVKSQLWWDVLPWGLLREQ